MTASAQIQTAQAQRAAVSAPIPRRPDPPKGIVDRHPARPVPGTLHGLQRQAGNSGLQRIINAPVIASALLRCGDHPCDCPAEVQLRAELSVSHPQDPAEREADRVADEVMRAPAGYPGPIRAAPAEVIPACSVGPPDGPAMNLAGRIDDASRMHLLLTFSSHPPLRTQDDLNAFLNQSPVRHRRQAAVPPPVGERGIA